MHKPPAVSYPVGRSRWQLILILSFLTLASLAMLALVQGIESASLQVFLLVVVVSIAAISLTSWRFSEIGILQWTGRSWHFSRWPDGIALNLGWVLDMQFFMLVNVTTRDGKRAWLWIESRQSVPKWLAVRRAVVCSQHLSGEEPNRLET